jgi:hypothetical protein
MMPLPIMCSNDDIFSFNIAVCWDVTYLISQTVWRHIPEECKSDTHHCENLKPYFRFLPENVGMFQLKAVLAY